MVLYPFAIWLGHGQVEPRFLAGLLLLAGFMRLPAMRAGVAGIGWLVGTLLLSLIALWGNHFLTLKLYPVLVNAAMLSVFTYSLLVPSIYGRAVRTPAGPRPNATERHLYPACDTGLVRFLCSERRDRACHCAVGLCGHLVTLQRVCSLSADGSSLRWRIWDSV